MDLSRVIASLAPADVVRRARAEVRDLAYDARDASPGSLFFCIRGANADGHDFAVDAVRRGAVALVVERELELDVPQVVVESVRRAMPLAAAEFFGHPSRELVVAGITGTNGKTTTAYLLHSILTAAGRQPALLTNVERRVGGHHLPTGLNTPEAIDLQRLLRGMVDAGDRSCVMEATSEASAQGRLDATRFAVLVFTNLTQDHLNFHGTMEAYFEAKRRLFAPGTPAVVNVDDTYGRRLAGQLAEVTTFGVAEDADVGPAALAGIELHLPGRFNVGNALAALAAARVLGVDDEAIAAGISAVASVPGRLELVDAGQPFTVLVDYAHTPDSLENVLAAARELATGRLICVFGAGGDRDRAKRPLMGRLAASLADHAIVTSDNPRGEEPLAIIEEIVAGAEEELEVEPDRRAAIERAIALAEDGDVVLIAGKGHEQGQEIAGHKLPFDDREVARDALRTQAARR